MNNVINASNDEKAVVIVDMPEDGNLTVCVMTLDGNIITYLNRGNTKAGEYYYTWGQGHCHMARLNEDMCSLDPDTYAESLISHDEEQQGFHEGSSVAFTSQGRVNNMKEIFFFGS